MGGMKKMDSTELEENIVDRLENGESKDDIILDLCESENMNWPEAEATLEQIQADNQHHITLTQSPLLVSIALIIFVGGAGLIVYSIHDLILKYLLFRQADAATGGMGTAFGFIGYLVLTGEGLLASGFLGIAMLIGSLRGMTDVWTAIFGRLGIFQRTG
jgi:hypothetical protein